MNRLRDYAEQVLGRRRVEIIDEFQALIEEMIPGAVIETTRDEIRIRAPSLARRMLTDPQLRFFPRMKR